MGAGFLERRLLLQRHLIAHQGTKTRRLFWGTLKPDSLVTKLVKLRVSVLL